MIDELDIEAADSNPWLAETIIAVGTRGSGIALRWNSIAEDWCDGSDMIDDYLDHPSEPGIYKVVSRFTGVYDQWFGDYDSDTAMVSAELIEGDWRTVPLREYRDEGSKK